MSFRMLARRYRNSFFVSGSARQVNARGDYSFWRRYCASLLGLNLPGRDNATRAYRTWNILRKVNTEAAPGMTIWLKGRNGNRDARVSVDLARESAQRLFLLLGSGVTASNRSSALALSRNLVCELDRAQRIALDYIRIRLDESIVWYQPPRSPQFARLLTKRSAGASSDDPAQPKGSLIVFDPPSVRAQRLAHDIAKARSLAMNLLVSLAGNDLREIDLSDMTFDGVDLTNVDLSQVDLAGADLRGAQLAGARLEGLIWSEDTRWPKELFRFIRKHSRIIGMGRFEVVGPHPEHELAGFR